MVRLLFLCVLFALNPFVTQAQVRVMSLQEHTTLGVDEVHRDFIPALRVVMQQTLGDYLQDERAAVRVDLLDSSQNQANFFLSEIAPSFSPQSALAFHFTEKAYFNGAETSSCLFYFYPERLAILLRRLEFSRELSRKDILYFIAFHEMGHCLLAHQQSLGKHKQVSARGKELVSDKFAFTLLYLSGQKDALPYFIEMRAQGDKDGKHYNPVELEQYHKELNDFFSTPEAYKKVSTVLEAFYLSTNQLKK